MDALSFLYFIEMALGIGLVIFVHEAGHFIAARLCGVRVETFSLGFGPRLFGWRRGDTMYQIAALPLGGFCKMAGEEQTGDGLPPAHDDLRAKSVGQRFFIYSGGVIMNVIFGLVVFPIILFYGVPFTPPVIGDAVPGSPAWHAKLQPGTEVLSVNGNPTIGFMFIAHEVALGSPEETRLEILEPGADEARLVVLKPEYNDDLGFSSIGVVPAIDEQHTLKVNEGSVAWEAGLRNGDQLVSVEGLLPELSLKEQFFLAKNRGSLTGDSMTITVRRDGSTLTRELVPERPEPEQSMLGVGVPLNLVAGLRPNPAIDQLGLMKGDRLHAVNGRTILRARDLELALVSSVDPVQMVVDRDGRRFRFTGPPLARAEAFALAEDIALHADLETDRVTITPGSAAARAGLVDGDRLAHIDGERITRWKDIKDRTKQGGEFRVDVEREGPDGAKERFAVIVAPEPLAPAMFGVFLRPALYTYRAESFGAAARVGMQASWKFLVDAWMTVKRMLLGQVSGKNMGGIISIGVVSYSWASLGLPKLLFFLCILSLNLAFLNVLPIPVLDGGHLVFLIIEKIKGSPVSERVFGYSQMVGIVLILSLMIYVTYNDLVRWVFPPGS